MSMPELASAAEKLQSRLGHEMPAKSILKVPSYMSLMCDAEAEVFDFACTFLY